MLHDLWIEFLQDYIFTLSHKARDKNKAADALSRRIVILTKMTIVVSGFERLRPSMSRVLIFTRYTHN